MRDSSGWSAVRLHLVVEIELWARLRAVLRGKSRRQLKCGLLQDILDAFEAGGEGFEVGRGADGLHALQTRFEIEQIGPAGGHAGADFVVGEAADVAEVVFDAVTQELASSPCCGKSKLTLTFDDDAHDALGGAAKTEWVAGVRWGHADLEAFGQRVPFVGKAEEAASRAWRESRPSMLSGL